MASPLYNSPPTSSPTFSVTRYHNNLSNHPTYRYHRLTSEYDHIQCPEEQNCVAIGPTPAFAPYLPNTEIYPCNFDVRMPNFQSMKTSDLVSAALGPIQNLQKQKEAAAPSQGRFPRLESDGFGSRLNLNKNVPLKEPEPSTALTRTQKRPLVHEALLPFEVSDNENAIENANQNFDCASQKHVKRSERVTKLLKQHSTDDSDSEQLAKPLTQFPLHHKDYNKTHRSIRKKSRSIRVPKTLDDAEPCDRMMWEWKNKGKGWGEIRREWKRLTGTTPGGSTLSVRYMKLNENFARNGAATDIDLLRFKVEVEQELMAQLWERVAEKMLAHSPLSEYNPKDLQKRYRILAQNDFDVFKVNTSTSRDDEDGKEAEAEADADEEMDEGSEEGAMAEYDSAHQQLDHDMSAHALTPERTYSTVPTSLQSITTRAHAHSYADYRPDRHLSSQYIAAGPPECTAGLFCSPSSSNYQQDRIQEFDESPLRKHAIEEQVSGPKSQSTPQPTLRSSPFLRSLVAYDSASE